MKIGEKITILRRVRGYSQEQLGLNLSTEQNGVSRQSVCDWENGRSEPKLENIKALAKLLDVSFDVLLDDELDLNDPETLSKVISKSYSSCDNKTSISIHYSIHEYEPFKRKFIKKIIICLISVVIGIIGIILLTLFNKNTVLFICGVIISGLFFGFFFVVMTLIASDFMSWHKNKNGRKIATLDYHNLTIYPRQNDYSNRAIFLPITKITKIQKLVDDKKYCDVEVIADDNSQVRVYVLKNVNNPDRLITVFNDAKSFLIEKKKDTPN